ncbi:MAG TPA: hypothetical protein VID77_13255 [Stellaceae bacterium]|jgi:hypothetical protein
MAGGERDIVTHESLLARRIGFLFRLEHVPALARRPASLAQRLRQRRGELIETLMRADAARRALHLPVSAELQQAVEMLWREAGAARRDADARLDLLRADLLRARGDGVPSGVRNAAQGRVIATG